MWTTTYGLASPIIGIRVKQKGGLIGKGTIKYQGEGQECNNCRPLQPGGIALVIACKLRTTKTRTVRSLGEIGAVIFRLCSRIDSANSPLGAPGRGWGSLEAFVGQSWWMERTTRKWNSRLEGRLFVVYHITVHSNAKRAAVTTECFLLLLRSFFPTTRQQSATPTYSTTHCRKSESVLIIRNSNNVERPIYLTRKRYCR